ncbi:2-keto-4-pentenoate hydratase [Roseovarius autotrophicus]|uniref:2-keto-4-pentenoate hydratase n=1 Tax=Roseovarius autotrophicus TaxID=2824121 RepID=UPI0019FDFB4B|nr:2-keto-4-pentenoate hydratase [Roseovarius autotrophicus]MBE0452985.1 2-keto-4-pentenoate hydratase [Roseovarius sp.]
MTDPLVEALIAARKGGPKLPETAGEGLTRARIFAVQEAVAARLGPVGGFKVACPPDAPIVIAPIMARDIHDSPAVITCERGAEVGIELEYAFRLTAPPPAPDLPDFETRLKEAVELLPAFELVQSRLADPKGAGAALKMLDNQLNGAVVLGAPLRDWQGVDVTRAGAWLRLGSETLLDGAAQVPGGDAFATLCALARVIGTHCGGLKVGHVVITGSLNGLPWVMPPLTAQGRIAGLGDVALRSETGQGVSH